MSWIQLQLVSTSKVRIMDLDKLNLVKICNGGSILGSSQSTMPLLHQEMTLASKVVKIDSKIIILLRLSKSGVSNSK